MIDSLGVDHRRTVRHEISPGSVLREGVEYYECKSSNLLANGN
jgi:hypothetical protein